MSDAKKNNLVSHSTSCDKIIHFEPITAKNMDAIVSLKVNKAQKGFIETIVVCLADATQNAYGIQWHSVAIYAENTLVGFAMYGSDKNLWLDRFMIDAAHQGRGYGKAALSLLLDHLCNEYNRDEVYLSVFADNILAIFLYKKLGFLFTGEIDTNGEHIMRFIKKRI